MRIAASLNNNLNMPTLIENSERKYRKIGLDERRSLIHMVIEEKLKIAEAARRLGINPSTADYSAKL